MGASNDSIRICYYDTSLHRNLSQWTTTLEVTKCPNMEIGEKKWKMMTYYNMTGNNDLCLVIHYFSNDT